MQEFNEKVAVITGGASGIGFALAEVFGEQGMKVVIADIEPAALDDALQKLRAKGVEATAVICDVGKAEAVENLAQTAVDTYGNIDIACNNAGVFTGGASWECSLADYQWLTNVNQWGVVHGIRSFVPRMIAQGTEAHVVTTASMAGLTTLPFSAIYNATKHAALALTECLHKDLELLAPQVKASVLCPELINTGIGQSKRNRPAEYSKQGDIIDTDASRLTGDSIIAGTAGGLDPRRMAERVLQGIKDEQFYLLAEDGWRDIAVERCNDIRDGVNPRILAPEAL